MDMVKEKTKIRRWTPEEKKDIDIMLEIITNTLDKNNIKYWLIGGSLLGAVRHGDMIPWDDDADIGVFDYEIDKILQLNKYFNELGYFIEKSWKIYKFKKIGTEFPFVDIFSYVKKINKYIMNDKELNEMWPNEYYLEEELFPLKKYKYATLELYGPNYPLDYLDRMYKNWRFVGKHTFDHKTSKTQNIVVDLKNPETKYKLKPYLYLSSESDIKKEYDENYNEKVIVIQN